MEYKQVLMHFKFPCTSVCGESELHGCWAAPVNLPSPAGFVPSNSHLSCTSSNDQQSGRWCYCAPRRRQLLRSPSCESTWPACVAADGPACHCHRGQHHASAVSDLLNSSWVSICISATQLDLWDDSTPRSFSRVRGWGALRSGPPVIGLEMWSRWWPLREDLSLTF